MATRRTFLQSLGAAAGLGLVGLGCGDDATGSDGGTADACPSCGDGGGSACATEEIINSNHGHTLDVSVADVEAAETKTYDIRGSAEHSHTVTIEAAQFEQLKRGMMITVSSSSAADHDHTVTIRCLTR